MRRLLLVLCTLTLAFFSSQPAASAPLADNVVFYPGVSIPFEHLAVNDGSAQDSILALLQDRQGYLWIGTQDGLSRYDGYSFTHFKHDPQNPDSISFDSVIALYEDRDGYLWVGTWGGGLNRYDPRTGKFFRFLPNTNDRGSLSSSVVTSIVQDQTGKLWVGTLGGLDLFDPLSGKFTHFRSNASDPSTLSSDAISVIVPTENGMFWIGTGAYGTTGGGLNLFDTISEKTQRFSASGDCLRSPNISAILVGRNDDIWIGHGGSGVPGGGLDHFNPKTGQCQHYDTNTTNGQFANNNVTHLLSDQDEQLWITVRGGGLLRMGPRTPGSFASIHYDSVNPVESLSSDNTSTLLLDRSNVLWVGTFDRGLNKLNLENLQFRVYRHNPNRASSLSSNQISAFAETTDGDLWIGTRETGLDRFNPATGEVVHFRYATGDPLSLSSDRILSLYADRDGTLWVGTANNGLNHFDPNTGKFQRYQHNSSNPNSLIDNEVTYITRDGSGNLWVATLAGLSRLMPGSTGFNNFTGFGGAPVALMANGDDLWIGTWGGGVSLFRLALPSDLPPPDRTRFNSLDTLTHDASNPNSLSENSVWALHHTADDDMIWFGTAHGLNRYDPKTGDYKIYTEKDGLSNATIQCIVEDQDGYLWVTTANGLARFDRRSETFRVYDKNDGLNGDDFNTNACFLSPTTGDIFVGGSNGFTVFNPRLITKNTILPTTVITNFTVFDQPYPFDPQGKIPVDLDYQQNFIAIDFAALDFHAPAKNTYSYMLEGFDYEWIQAGTSHIAKYTNLPAGEYTFRVRGANSDGIWSQAEAFLHIQIVPPFWLRWQFQAGGVLLLLSLIAGGIQWRFRTIRKNAVRLEEIVRQRTVELRDSNILLEREVEQRKHAEAELARRADEKLQQSEERFRAVFESSAMGVVVMTLDQRIEQVNQKITRLTGYSSDELTGFDLSKLIMDADREIDQGLYSELLGGQRDQYTIEKRHLRKDGSVFWARVNFSAVHGYAGKPLYTIGMLEDITEEKLAAERLTAQEAEHRRILEKRIAKRTAELNKVSEQLREKAAQDAVSAERIRLARDLHDAVTQTLFSATLIADAIPKLWKMDRTEGVRQLDELRRLTRGALAEMRTLLVELRPNALVEVPLPALFRQLADALTGRSRISIQCNCSGERILPADIQIGFYRIAQEALNNIVKHAKATQAVVTLSMGETVSLLIVDDGIGVDLNLVTADHLGIKIMRERAEAIGAKFNIESIPNLGTRVSVTWG